MWSKLGNELRTLYGQSTCGAGETTGEQAEGTEDTEDTEDTEYTEDTEDDVNAIDDW